MKLLKLLSYLVPIVAIALIIYSLNSPNTISQSELSTLPTCEVKPRSVHDGDTIRVLCQGQEMRIRFSCIDAPELRQEQGKASRDYLRSLLNQAGNRVRVRTVDTDRFGRTVADLYTDNGLVQLQQTRAGWVWANTKYKSDCREWRAISAAEQEARRARRGIWAGNPMPPWEWRRRNR
jgi:endonuclease YncB( thermonuclease family)